MNNEELEARIQRLVNDRAFVLNWRAELAIVVREAERRGAARMRSAAVEAVRDSAERSGSKRERAIASEIAALDIDAVLQEEP